MAGDSTALFGIEIPSTDPVFVGTIVGIHIPLGLHASLPVPWEC
jgi:hypothetical protein